MGGYAYLVALVFAPAVLADSHKMMDDIMMSSASASASSLPGTGGTPVLPLITAAALVLVVGSGMLAATVVRRNP